MALKLNSVIPVNDIDELKINSFGVDVDRQTIYISYSEMDAGGAVVSNRSISAAGQEFIGLITAASTEVGGDIYAALKNAMYAEIKRQKGISGVVT